MSPSVSRSIPGVRALSAVVLFASVAAAQQPLTALSTAYPAGSAHGDDAAVRFADRLDGIAEQNHMTGAELRQLLHDDPTLWISGSGELFFVDPLPLVAEAPPEEPGSFSGSDPIDTSDAFNLSSNPGADKTLYLDFTGHHSFNNGWGHNITFPAYNTSGDSSTFSTGELQQIIEWWERVVEDYSSYDINVTTVEPPLSDLIKSNSGDTRFGIRVVVTQPTSGFGDGIGGIALLNSFNDNVDNPCFAFNKGNNAGSMTCSHESGHTFGLQHDGLNGQSYHPGTGSGETSWGPIMGAPFSANLVQWSNGDYDGHTSTQNDTAIIANSSNGVHFLADDHGDDRFNASPVSAPQGCPAPAPGIAEGLIETRTDVDAFVFTTTGGAITINALPYSPGGNLDIQMEIQDAGGTTIATVNGPNDADASTTLALSAGTYYVLIDGVGKTGVYSDYGSLGRYTVTVSAPGAEPVVDLGNGLASSLGLKPVLTVSGVLCPGNDITYSLGLAGGSKPAFLFLGFSELSVPFKGGVLVPSPDAVVALQTNFLGGITIVSPWPAGLPGGLELYLQYWLQDNLGPVGFTASNAVLLVAP